jgi:hypothetical protein
MSIGVKITGNTIMGIYKTGLALRKYNAKAARRPNMPNTINEPCSLDLYFISSFMLNSVRFFMMLMFIAKVSTKIFSQATL